MGEDMILLARSETVMRKGARRELRVRRGVFGRKGRASRRVIDARSRNKVAGVSLC